MNKSRITYHVSRIIILLPLMFLAFGCNKNQPQTVAYKTGTAVIAGHQLNIQIADTDILREKGLGGRDALFENDGMLFVFPAVGRYAFWMKGMKFSLDFIWIKDHKVVEITPNVAAEPNLPDAALVQYLPHEEIDSVIEVNVGWSTTNKIKVGDEVIVDFNQIKR